MKIVEAGNIRIDDYVELKLNRAALAVLLATRLFNPNPKIFHEKQRENHIWKRHFHRENLGENDLGVRVNHAYTLAKAVAFRA